MGDNKDKKSCSTGRQCSMVSANKNTANSSRKEKLFSIIQQERDFSPPAIKEEINDTGKFETILWVAPSILVILGLLLGGAYLKNVKFYSDHFLTGTFINGIDCSRLTVAQASELTASQKQNYSITLFFKDGINCTINGSDFGYTYSDKEGVSMARQSQDETNWMKGYFSKTSYDIPGQIAYDEGSLDNCLESLEPMLEKNQKAAENAYIDYDGGKFAIIPEKDGTQIDTLKLENVLNEAVSSGKRQLYVEDAGVYKEADIKSDSEQIKRQLNQLNDMAGISITYELYDGSTRVLDGSVIRDWLSVDDGGNYYIDQDALAAKASEYAGALAQEFDSYGGTFTFTGANNIEHTVSGGYYGWKINKDAEAAKIVEAINSHSSQKRAPEYSTRIVSDENGGIGGTFVEMDLTAQHLWYHMNGSVVLESDIVSGTRTNPDKITPAGVYMLDYKQLDRVLVGEYDEYHTLVHYWIPFNGGIGLHDAYWRGSFGGDIYMYDGSHGCINLPSDVAASMYDMIDLETPIVLYYND